MLNEKIKQWKASMDSCIARKATRLLLLLLITLWSQSVAKDARYSYTSKNVREKNKRS